MTNLVCSLDMDLHDQIPVCIFHVLEADVSQNAGVVDEHVYPAKGLDSSLNDLVTILYRVVIGHGVSAGLFDLVDDYVSSLGNVSCCA